MPEQWRQIEGWPGYDVSDNGLVRSWRKMGCKGGLMLKPRTLKPAVGNHGRRVVVLSSKTDKKQFLIYRLVLTAFTGPCPEGFEACHNDGNCLNDNISNLRWDTASSNQMDRHKHGTGNRGEKHPLAKLNNEKVEAIRLCLWHGAKQRAVASFFHIDRSQISRIQNGRVWV